MAARVWVSTLTSDVNVGSTDPGKGWEEVGAIDSSRETDLWKQVQTYPGQRSTRSPDELDVFVDGDPDSRWVSHAATSPGESFWMSIDLFGDVSDAGELRPELAPHIAKLREAGSSPGWSGRS